MSKNAFNKIAEGLKDAIAFAEGGATRGRIEASGTPFQRAEIAVAGILAPHLESFDEALRRQIIRDATSAAYSAIMESLGKAN